MKNLLKNLIAAQSTHQTGERLAAEVLTEYFSSRGVPAQLDIFGDDRANCTAHIKSDSNGPGLIIACHIDVVPANREKWNHEPFEPTEIDGKIFGRGTADMKGGIAATAKAIADIVESGVKLKGDLIFTATAGEETDSCGMKRFVEQYKNSIDNIAGAIIPEPTNFDIVVAHKGLLWLEIVTAGKTAHGSMPQLGINAIDSMRRLLNELAESEMFAGNTEIDNLLGQASMSINQISGGAATNVVPDKCTACADIRTIPNQSHEKIVSDIENITNRIKNHHPDFDAHVNILRSVDAFETDPDCDFVKQLQESTGISTTKTVPYTTDGPFLANLNLPTVIFGPGKSQLCHKPDEYIEVTDIEKAAEVFKKIILDFLT